MIRLQVLGSVELRGTESQEILSVLSQPKRTALLAYLAIATPHGFHRRDKLLGLFWPELNQGRGRAALRKALHHLRRSLGDETILSRGDEEVGLNRDLFSSDLDEVKAAIREGRNAEAVEAYSGDLLEGFFLPGCPEFEKWLHLEREALRTKVARGAWGAAHHWVESGRVTEGVVCAHRALGLVPTNETEVRSFMTALASAGDRAAAARFFETFALRLREAIDLEPSEETLALLTAIRSGSAPGTDRNPRGGAGHDSPRETGSFTPPTPSETMDPDIGSSSPGTRIKPPRTRDGQMVEWGAAYIAGGWALIQLVSLLDGKFGWPSPVRPILNVFVVLVSLLALILAWYHGRGGSRKISGPELLMVALLLVVLGIALMVIPG